MLKVLFVGLGGIGQRHLRNLRRLRGDAVEILAWRTRRELRTLNDALEVETGANVEEKYGVRHVGDLEEALAERPGIVFVCNPTSLHLDVALSAARAGCNLFIEKPIADSLERTAQLCDLVRERNLVALVGYQLRFHPLYLRLQAAIAQHAIGLICAVRSEVGEYLPSWHPYEDYRRMYAARRDLGGGVLLTQIHEFDYLYGLFGQPSRVFTIGGHLSRLEIDVEDAASVLMDCRVDGRRVPIRLDLDFLQNPPARSCVVIGDRGKVVVDFRGSTFRRFDVDGCLVEENECRGFARNDLFLDEMSHFLDCVERGVAPRVSIPDGLQSLRAALAARESLESGMVIELSGGEK